VFAYLFCVESKTWHSYDKEKEADNRKHEAEKKKKLKELKKNRDRIIADLKAQGESEEEAEMKIDEILAAGEDRADLNKSMN
jgi:hypothetical protein